MSPKQHVQELDSKPELDAQEYIDTPDEELKGGKAKVNNQLDQAAQILADAGHVEFSKEEKKRVLKWIDFYVCLPMCIVYWIQQVSLRSAGRVESWRCIVTEIHSDSPSHFHKPHLFFCHCDLCGLPGCNTRC